MKAEEKRRWNEFCRKHGHKLTKSQLSDLATAYISGTPEFINKLTNKENWHSHVTKSIKEILGNV